ncbi:hypothetical protein BHU72_04705 [Desulfuribacillus stibiiarsenatis]|uniref:Histidine kinase/HSP90-like ATPase domain-containing protein n=1 Tax=Desulfuribacillus stibiiarsenatis TaxID=1390249 RepID=A0A1E5L5W0_9FIRM|nr:ATP-binding protein [Desulfuribacillus stibiiarsenatis]OEH85393.1 hypothetical protein BHU72_04705 [Desulfuribacillus stibiiarsenatis]
MHQYIVISSSMKEGNDLREQLLQILRNDFPGKKLYVLAVLEMVMNSIEHGNQMDEKKSVTIKILEEVNRVSIEVTDEGIGFNWKDKITDLERLADPDFSLRGRGILLAKEICDQLMYKDEGRTVVLIKEL